MDASAAKLAGLGAAVPESAAGGDQVSLSREALALLEGEHQASVNARVLQRLDELNGSVLDILA